jgi:hypothetical protein
MMPPPIVRIRVPVILIGVSAPVRDVFFVCPYADPNGGRHARRGIEITPCIGAHDTEAQQDEE